MCACEGAYVCLRCRAIDYWDWKLAFEPSDDEVQAQRRYDEARQAPEDVTHA